MANYSPKFPLFFSQEGGYASNKSIKEVVKQNIKNIVLTSPGERIMIPEFGVGIRNFLFEQNSAQTVSLIRRRIENQIAVYMPFIELQEIQPIFNQNELYISIKYFILPISEEDILSLSVQ